MEKTSAHDRRVWDLDPNKFCFPDYLEFQKDLKDQFRLLKEIGISKEDLMEVWEKCGVIGINFTSDTWRVRGLGTIEGFKERGLVYDDCTGVPQGWKDRYGSDVGYWIELRKMERSEIRAAVKEIAKEYPEGWDIKIKPKEFYRALFFHETAHSIAICGRFLNELSAMSREERLKFEHEAWLWALKMARQKNPKIRILHPSVKKKNKLEHSNFCQWYQLLKMDDEMRRRKKGEAMKKAA